MITQSYRSESGISTGRSDTYLNLHDDRMFSPKRIGTLGLGSHKPVVNERIIENLVEETRLFVWEKILFFWAI